MKQALFECWKAEHDGQNRNLHKACKSILFFGTPHRGSSDAAWGTLVANIAKAAQLDVNKSILRDLYPSSGSSTLSGIQEDFNGLLGREHYKIYTFQEAAGKYAWNPLSSKVTNTNHLAMCWLTLVRSYQMNPRHSNPVPSKSETRLIKTT